MDARFLAARPSPPGPAVEPSITRRVFVARAAAAAAGVAIPLTVARVLGGGSSRLALVLVAGTATAVLLVRLHGRVEGWKLSLVLIALFALISVAR